MADKDVTWRLSVSRDPKAVSEARAFAEAVVAEGDRIEQAAPLLSIRTNAAKVEKDLLSFRESDLKSVADFEKRKVQIVQAGQLALTKTLEQFREEILEDEKLMNKLVVELAEQTSEELKRVEKMKQAFINRQNGLRTQEEIKSVKDQEREGRAALARRLADYKASKAAEAKEAERAAKSSQNATKEAERLREKAEGFAMRGRSAMREFDEAVNMVGSSFFQLGRGITAMGLIGEEDFQKVQDSLLGIQATYDLFSSSAQMVRGISKAWDQYRTAVNAAEAAQKALTAAELAGDLVRSRGAAGSAAKTAGKVASDAAGGTLLSTIFGLGAGGTLLSTIFGLGGANTAKSALAKAFPIMAAAIVAKLTTDIVSGAGSINQESLSGKVLGNRTFANFAGNLDLAMGNKSSVNAQFAKSEADTERLAKKTNDQITQRAELDKKINEGLAARTTLEAKHIEQAAKSLEYRLKGKSLQEQTKLLSQAEVAEQAKISVLRYEAMRATDADGNLRQELMARVEAHEKRLRDIVKQRGEAEADIAQKRLRFAQDALKASRAELDTANERLAAERSTLDAARQRFGGMSREDQDEVLDIVKQARRGVDLSVEQLGKLSSLGTEEAERIIAQQKRKRVAGDNSLESLQLEGIRQEQKDLLALRRRTEREAPDKFNSEGEVVGKLVGAKRQKLYEDIEERLRVLATAEGRIRQNVEQDARLRASLFGEERQGVGSAAADKMKLEAKINHQITVVAKFDNTAKEIAQKTVAEMTKAITPFMSEVDTEIRKLQHDVAGLIKTRRQGTPGRPT